MIAEIIYYNVAWFTIMALVGIVSGIIWAWKPHVALIVFTMIIGFIVWSVWITINDGVTTFTNVPPLYYYIGAVIGGLTFSTWFDLGKNIYQ